MRIFLGGVRLGHKTNKLKQGGRRWKKEREKGEEKEGVVYLTTRFHPL